MMFVRHLAIKGIVKSRLSFRRGRSAFQEESSVTSSSSPYRQQPNKNQALHQGLEQLQRRPGQATTTSSSSSLPPAASSAARVVVDNPHAAYTITNKPTRLDRLNQAAINAACSFFVVLLAGQSYKAGAERRRALDHLEAATEVLKETQGRLKQLVDPVTAEEIAAACRHVIVQQQQQQESSNNKKNQSATLSTGGLWSRTRTTEQPADRDGPNDDNDTDEVQQQLSAIIHAKLRSMIDPKIDLDEEDRDKELVRELVKTIEPPTRKQVFTI